jgi:hypothetical protein
MEWMVKCCIYEEIIEMAISSGNISEKTADDLAMSVYSSGIILDRLDAKECAKVALALREVAKKIIDGTIALKSASTEEGELFKCLEELILVINYYLMINKAP